MKINEAAAILRAHGCYCKRHRANHDWWYSPITKLHFPFPRHGTQELASGTKKNIEELSGVKL